jgi:hypothetical protein
LLFLDRVFVLFEDQPQTAILPFSWSKPLHRYILSFWVIYLFLLLLCWGCIVTFTKVLTIYHSWIHPPPSFSFISFPLFLE